MFVGIADPLAIRRDPQQLLGHDQAEQLDIGQGRFASRMAMSRKAESGQDPIIEMHVKCGREGVQILHAANHQ